MIALGILGILGRRGYTGYLDLVSWYVGYQAYHLEVGVLVHNTLDILVRLAVIADYQHLSCYLDPWLDSFYARSESQALLLMACDRPRVEVAMRSRHDHRFQ